MTSPKRVLGDGAAGAIEDPATSVDAAPTSSPTPDEAAPAATAHKKESDK